MDAETAYDSSKEERPAAGDRLLDAAESLVAREGVANLTLEAVAREAGVSKGGLLYHFPSKSALVAAVVERLVARCESDQRTVLAADHSKGAFTRAYLLARRGMPGPTEKPVHTAILAAAGTDPKYLEPVRARLREWQARLESDGLDPAMATIVRLTVDGMCLGDLLGMPMPADELRDRIVAKLLDMTKE